MDAQARSAPFRPASTRALALMLALLLPAVPVVAQANGAQPNETPEPAPSPTQLSIEPDRAEYLSSEIVQLIIKNEGSVAIRGRFELVVHQIFECPPGEVCMAVYSEGVKTFHEDLAEFPAQSSRLIEWDRLTDSGTLAEPGEYLAFVELRASDDVTHSAESPHFVLLEDGGRGAFSVTIDHPYEGEVVPASDVVTPVYVPIELRSNRALDAVGLYVDGVLRQRFANLSTNADAYSFHTQLLVAPGAHLLSVESVGTDGEQAWSWSNFNVGEPVTPPVITVRTDRAAYGPAEQVVIEVYNHGPSALTGTPDVRVVDQSGRRVWTLSLMTDVEHTLKPGERRQYAWDQLDSGGERVPIGVYSAQVQWGGAVGASKFEIASRPGPTPLFSIAFVSPRQGDAVGDDLALALAIGPPGASEVEVAITNGDGYESTLRHAYAVPSAGRLDLRQSLAGAPEGMYHVQAIARGPGGDAMDSTYFRLIRGEDQAAPQLVVSYPAEGQQLPLRFPIAFRVTDDVGITYAEVRIGDELVGRQSWTNPVMGSAVLAFVPAHLVGEQMLTLAVFDGGQHEARQQFLVVLRDQTGSCESALLEAKDQVEAAYGDAPRPAAPSSAAAVESAEDVVGYKCPEAAPTARPIEQGAYTYRRADQAVVDVQVKGVQLFDQVAPSSAAVSPSTLVARGKLLVVDAPSSGGLHFDLNGTWIATQRGGHVVLENTHEGTRVLLVFVGGSPELLGHRLAADLPANGRVVVRPLASALDDQVADAIVDGLIGAEISVDGDEPQSVSYSDLDLTVTTGANAVQAILSSPQHEGRTLVFSLGPDAPLSGDLEVLLDGLPLARASSLEDVLDPHDDDLASEYYLVQADGETTVIVSIGHFSTRYLVIQAAKAIEPFLTPIAIIGGLTVVSVAAFVLFRRDD